MNTRLPLMTWLYFTAQAVNLTAAIMSVTMAAVAGGLLASHPAGATIPYGFQFVAVTLVTYPAARFMRHYGRKKGFMLGNVFLALAGVLGFISMQQQSFGLLIATHALLGVYIGFANFNRFAATDGLAQALQPKATSLVVAGGVLAAFVGPFMASQLRDVAGLQAFAAGYAAFIGLALLASLAALPIAATAKQPRPSTAANAGTVPQRQLLKQRQVISAIGIAALGYGIMNLLMVAAELHMTHRQQSFDDMSWAVQWHVVAMFAPAFFSAPLLRRFGNQRMLHAGMLLLMAACAINVAAPHFLMTVAGLVILGLGWSLTYVGGAALLTAAVGDHPDAFSIQGINDACIAVMATLGAFLPAPLMVWLGWQTSNLVILLLCGLVLAASLVANTAGRWAAVAPPPKAAPQSPQP